MRLQSRCSPPYLALSRNDIVVRCGLDNLIIAVCSSGVLTEFSAVPHDAEGLCARAGLSEWTKPHPAR